MAITLRNQASIDYTSCGSAQTRLSNVASTVLTGTLGIEKTAYDDTYRAGQVLTFLLNVTSESENELPGGAITIQDDLGAYPFNGQVRQPLTYLSYQLYVDGALNTTAGVTVTAGTNAADGVTFTITGLPADFRVATIVYQAQVNEFAGLTEGISTIQNTSVLSVAGVEVDRDTAAVDAGCYADITVEKSMSPNPVTDGGPLTYTFVIRNAGTSSPTQVTLRDTFTPALAGPLTSVTVDGAPVSNYTYDPATGAFVIGAAAADPYTFDIPAATVTQDPVTGAVSVTPGEVTVSVTGTVNV